MIGAETQDALYRALADRLERTIARKFGRLDRHQVEDACMFAWTQLAASRTVEPSFALPWLTTVATNEALRLWRVGGRTESLDAEGMPEPAAALDLDAQVDAHELAAALATLKPQQRLALGLFAQGYSYREIAELTGRTYTWVNRHIGEGKAALRAKLR